MSLPVAGRLIALLCLSFSIAFAANPEGSVPAPSNPGAVLLTAVESQALIAALNDEGKLVPEAALPNVRLREVKESDCQGVRLAGGKRVVLHHPKGGYGYTGSLSSQQADGSFKSESFSWVGTIHTESPLSLGGQRIPAGSYVIEIYADYLRLGGNSEKASYYDARQGKQVPQRANFKLALKDAAPPEMTEGKEAAVLTLSAVKGMARLEFLKNAWPLQPR